MIIALDYDNTYTADKAMWDAFILGVSRHKHVVFIVTSRDAEDPVEDAEWFDIIGVEIIYCDYHAKRRVCDVLGIDIDIWIDDNPKYIDENYPEHEAELWRGKCHGS